MYLPVLFAKLFFVFFLFLFLFAIKTDSALAANLDLYLPEPPHVNLNEQYTIRIRTSGIVASRVSVYLAERYTNPDDENSETNVGRYANISNTNFCKWVAEGNQYLHLHGILNCNASGVCDGNISNTISQRGQHRVIAVAMRGEETCAPGGTNANDIIVAMNKENILTGVSTNGGGGTGGGGTGGGSGGGSIDPPAGFGIANLRHSTITTLRALAGRIGSFSIMLLGFLAIVGIVIAGMKYISSGGDEKKAETAKKALLFTVYGIIITVVSVTLINTTIAEVGRLIAARTPTATNTDNVDTVLERINTWGGPDATILNIIGQENGMVWRFIRLATLYAELISFFYILYASFLYMTSYGDESKAESAKKTLIWALIGLAVIISATSILNMFGEVLT